MNNKDEVEKKLEFSSKVENLKLDDQEIDAQAKEMEMALSLIVDGHIELAISAGKNLILKTPNTYHGYAILGYIYFIQKKHQAALFCYEQALKYKNNDVDFLSNIGAIYQELGDFNNAIRYYYMATDICPTHATAYSNLGALFYQQGDLENAILLLKKAIHLQSKPDQVKSANTYNTIGQVYFELGDFNSAIHAFKIAISINPFLFTAYRYLSNSMKYNSINTDEVNMMISLLENKDIKKEELSDIHFALGKIYDDCKIFDKAFFHYQEGNKIEKSRCNFDYKIVSSYIDRLINFFTKGFFESKKHLYLSSGRHDINDICFLDEKSRSNVNQPIFIVGMPRSGTTLLEQIMSSHSKISSAGEVLFFNQLEHRLSRDFDLDIFFDNILKITKDDIMSISSEYVDSLLKKLNFNDNIFIIDKQPDNFLRLGLIKLVFPDAKIIHCVRHPVDTCLSIYFQKFTEHHAYAYDLNDIAFYYEESIRVMNYWKSIMPILTVQYESLVSNFETTTKDIFSFCNLSWEDSCIDFYKKEGRIQTASLWQARQPLNKTLPCKWKNYSNYIELLLKKFS